MAKLNRIVSPKPEDYANLREENHTTFIYVKDYIDGMDAKEHRQKAFWYGPSTTVVEFKNAVIEAYGCKIEPSELVMVWIGRTLADENEEGELETMGNALNTGPRGGYPPIIVVKRIKKGK